MGIDPTQTIVDLVTTTGELDPDKLGGYVVHHASGMDVLAAPLRPEDAELVTEDRIGQLVDVAKVGLRHRRARHAAALRRDDARRARPQRPPGAGRDDGHPDRQERKLALQTLNLLQYPRERIALVVNRPLGRADLRESDISRTLDMPISAVIPVDKEIATAVNRGVPVTVSASRSPAAKAMRELAEQLLPSALGTPRPRPPLPRPRAAQEAPRAKLPSGRERPRQACPGSPSRRTRRRRELSL